MWISSTWKQSTLLCTTISTVKTNSGMHAWIIGVSMSKSATFDHVNDPHTENNIWLSIYHLPCVCAPCFPRFVYALKFSMHSGILPDVTNNCQDAWNKEPFVVSREDRYVNTKTHVIRIEPSETWSYRGQANATTVTWNNWWANCSCCFVMLIST